MMDGDPENLAEWAKNIPTFVEGKYITFHEFVEKHYVYQPIQEEQSL
jgi:hypothetical protein